MTQSKMCFKADRTRKLIKTSLHSLYRKLIVMPSLPLMHFKLVRALLTCGKDDSICSIHLCARPAEGPRDAFQNMGHYLSDDIASTKRGASGAAVEGSLHKEGRLEQTPNQHRGPHVGAQNARICYRELLHMLGRVEKTPPPHPDTCRLGKRTVWFTMGRLRPG